MLEKNGELKNYDSVEVAPCIRETREDLITDHEFVDQKYHKYVSILAERLNRIHDTDHNEFFWKKCLALGLLRNITLLYDVFKVTEANFSAEENNCRILSETSYLIPKDFNEQRDFFQCTAYGQEQIFSTYINLFYPGEFESFDDQFSWPVLPGPIPVSSMRRVLNKFKRVTPKKIFDRLLKAILGFRQPRVVVIESFFSAKHQKDLEEKSRGNIRWLAINSGFEHSDDIQWDKRAEIALMLEEFDRFDQFFFESMKNCFPKVFVEDFNQVYSTYTRYFQQFPKLKYVVNESWIGNNYSAMAIAVLQKKGIKHIYNEHNFLSHHFLCHNHKYIFPLVDEFVSLGWFREEMPKLIKGSSLFEWIEEQQYSKEHKLLFVSGQPAIKPPEVNAAYGDFGAFNARSHLDFNKNFFDSLSESTIRLMVYRGYPTDSFRVAHLEPPMFVYDQEYVLVEYMGRFKLVDNKSRSAKILMQKSDLVIIDYLSTSYIESMLANIPTIFFWNQEIYPLSSKYTDFYEDLIRVGICQTEPSAAARFIDDIIDDPYKWWNQPLVQKAKNGFIAENFGNINVVKEYLLHKSGDP